MTEARKIAEQIVTEFGERWIRAPREVMEEGPWLIERIDAALSSTAGYRAGVEDAAKVADDEAPNIADIIRIRLLSPAAEPAREAAMPQGEIGRETVLRDDLIRDMALDAQFSGEPAAEPAPEPEGMETTAADCAKWIASKSGDMHFDWRLRALANDFDRVSRSRDVGRVVEWLRADTDIDHNGHVVARHGSQRVVFRDIAERIESGEPWKDRT